MTKKLLSELTKLQDYEFVTLEHHFFVARKVRNLITKYGLDFITISTALGIGANRFKEVINGSYPVDLMLLSKLQVFEQDLETDAAMKQVEEDGIQFANYKNQYPILINRVESLLKFFEDNNLKAPL